MGSRVRQAIHEAKLVNYSPDARSSYHESYLGVMKIHVDHFPEGAMQASFNGCSAHDEFEITIVVSGLAFRAVL